MKLLYTFVVILILSSLISAQWEERRNGLPEILLPTSSIDAADENTVFIASGFSVYRTTNAGMLWDSLGIVSGAKIFDISSPSLNRVWVCTGEQDSIPASIFRSTDSGLTWGLQYSDTSKTNFFNYIEMFDTLKGVAMGDAPSADKPALFLRTTDGGENWISMNNDQLIGMSSGQIWARLDFTDLNTCYFYSSNPTPDVPQRIYKTTDGGANWIQLQWNGQITVLKFFDENIGIGVKYNTTLYFTNNGGFSWKNFSCPDGWGNDIEFLKNDASKVWMCKGEKLYGSLDTGKTWVEYPMGEHFTGCDIVFTENDHGWLISFYNGVLGQFSTVYYTSNGGDIILTSAESGGKKIPVNFSLRQNYPNPFNPTTKIKYTIPAVEWGHAPSLQTSLIVYDILGREVATLVNEEKKPGSYEINFNAKGLVSGVYFYQLKADEFVSTKKMILIE